MSPFRVPFRSMDEAKVRRSKMPARLMLFLARCFLASHQNGFGCCQAGRSTRSANKGRSRKLNVALTPRFQWERTAAPTSGSCSHTSTQVSPRTVCRGEGRPSTLTRLLPLSCRVGLSVLVCCNHLFLYSLDGRPFLIYFRFLCFWFFFSFVFVLFFECGGGGRKN